MIDIKYTGEAYEVWCSIRGLLKSFDCRSDDYAATNAYEYAKEKELDQAYTERMLDKTREEDHELKLSRGEYD